MAKSKPVPSDRSAPVAPVPDDAEGRPSIFHEEGQLPSVLDDLLDALAASPPGFQLYVWSGGLCRLYRLPEAQQGPVSRSAGAIILHPIDAAHLAELATRAAVHYKYDRRSSSWRVTDCSRRIAESLLARGYWPQLRHLEGVIEAPTIDANGRVLDRPGFDGWTGLYLAQVPPGYASPPDEPTRDDAAAAAERLMDAVATFPYVDRCDHVAMAAAIIGGVVRRRLPSAPMVGISANLPGTGKTILAQIISTIAQGRPGAMLALGNDEAETEKRLYAALLAGDGVIILDNCEAPLKGAVLCQIATQSAVRFRPLGGSTVVTVPTCATLISTGNQLTILGDLKRRVLYIRLDAQCERPERRHFERHPIEYVAARRGALIRDALIIIRAYVANGAPALEGLTPYGGFEEWDRLVRRPLVWLGYPDPLSSAEVLRDSDPDLEATRAMLAAWHAAYGMEAATVSDALAKARDGVPRFDGGFDPSHPDLKDAMHAVCGERLDARRLGGWLRRHRDTIVDGLRLERAKADSHAKVARWRVISAG